MYPPVSLSHLVIRLERKSTNERREPRARKKKRRKRRRREIARKKEAGDHWRGHIPLRLVGGGGGQRCEPRCKG